MKKFFAFVVLTSLVACGSKSTDTVDLAPSPDTNENSPHTSSQDSGAGDVVADAGSDTSLSDSSSHVPTNQAECVSACESNHPKATTLSKQFDAACYLAGACEPVCNNIPAGKNFPPVSDVDAAAPVACPAQFGEGVDPIMTPSAACSTCLANTPACCTLWVAIFGSADGRDLNKCANACFTKFTK